MTPSPVLPPRLTTVGLLLLPLLAGCSGGGPATPAPSPEATVRGPADPHSGLVAAFQGTLDPATGALTVEPMDRGSAAIGDTFSEVGLTRAFNGQAGFGRHFWAEAVRRTSATTVEVDFAVRHPFTAEKRPDLAIFNMKLWVAAAGLSTTVAGTTGAPGLVTNADGHGDMWSLTATDAGPGLADVQPYVILHEDPASAPFDWRSPAGWNVLFPGQSSVDTVALDLGVVPPGPVDLHLYLTADYGQSAVRATRQDPQYSLPEFAGNAPWKVHVTELANNLVAGNPASTADYRLDIWDWKHGRGLGSDVTDAQVYAPALQAAPLSPALSGTGADPTPLTANFTLVNNLSAVQGTYWGLVAVTDQATGVALKDNLVTPVSVSSYATYQWFPIAVGGVAATPPTATISRCLGDPVSPTIAETFDGSTSTPGTNPIATYEWDFDYDGSTFTVDATGITTRHGYPASGTYVVALRVADAQSNSDIETTAVAVSGAAGWQPPVRVTNNVFSENVDYDSANSLTVGPDGTVHLVYCRWIYQPPYDYAVFHQTLAPCGNATWSAPATVYQGPGFAQVFRYCSSAMGADGVLHACFGGSGSGSWSFQHASYTNGVWSPPNLISAAPPSGYWDYAQIATSGANKVGTLLVTSTTQGCPGSPAPPDVVHFSEFVGGSWTPVQQIGTADVVISISSCGSWSWMNHSLSLSGTNNGEWVAVWESLVTPYTSGPVPATTKCLWTRTTGGAWAAAADLYTATPSYDTLRLDRAPNGEIWMVCRHGSGNSTGLAKFDGTAWSPDVIDVFSSAAGYPTHELAFDASGRGIAIATAGAPNTPLRVKRFNQTDTLAAIAALPDETVEPLNGFYRLGADVAAVGDGRFVAAWVSTKFGDFNSGMEFEASLYK